MNDIKAGHPKHFFTICQQRIASVELGLVETLNNDKLMERILSIWDLHSLHLEHEGCAAQICLN